MSNSIYNILKPLQKPIGILDNFGDALKNYGQDLNIGNNGKLYTRKSSGRIFNGNQHTKVKSAIKFGKAIKKYTGPAGRLLSGLELGAAIHKDGGTIGYNTKIFAAETGGGIAGGIAGAKIGAIIGAPFGGIGAPIGAFIGGVIGSYWVGEGASNLIR